jgi:hypothetical protein
VKLAVMNPAQRHDELIANPMAERARLPKSEVVSIRRAPAADQARLRTHKLAMRLVAFPDELQKWCCLFGIQKSTRWATDVVVVLFSRGSPPCDSRQF